MSIKNRCASWMAHLQKIIFFTLLWMILLVLLQSREQQLINTHALQLGIFFDFLTLTLWNIYTDIVVMPFEILGVGGGFFPRRSAVSAILLWARGHSKSLTAERTNLFAADLHGRSRFFLLFICPVTLDLHLVTAVNTVFRTVRCRLKFHTAHLAFACEHRITPWIVVISILSDIGCKVKYNPKFMQISLGKPKIQAYGCGASTKIVIRSKIILDIGCILIYNIITAETKTQTATCQPSTCRQTGQAGRSILCWTSF